MPKQILRTIAIIPAFNEERTAGNVIRAALRAKLVDGIIFVNDGSVDNTTRKAKEALSEECKLGNGKPIKFVNHASNLGKAEAMQTGAKMAYELGDLNIQTLIFLDADLSAIKSRETPHNRYLHKLIIDKLTGRQATNFSQNEVLLIEEDLLNLLAGYIDKLISPVKSGEQVMSIGMLARNRLADQFRDRLNWGMLAGSRAISVELWESMIKECRECGLKIKDWEMEAALNSYARLRRDESGRKLNRRISKLLMTNVVHVGSRYKAYGVLPGLARMARIHLGALKGFVKFAVKL